jgi:GntR family transcriptional regulator, galactonate operon transcriptional repressor
MSAARQRVVQGVVADLAEGRLRHGDSLPAPLELARRFDVSAAAARDAMSELEARGLAELDTSGHATVCPEARWDVLAPDVLEPLLVSRDGPRLLGEYLEYRRIVEVAAAGLAAEHATTEDLSALSTCVAAMTAATEEADFDRADVTFHRALVAAGGNRPLEAATDALRPALCTARRLLARPHLRDERGLPEHQRILAAVAQGDVDAARTAMAAHLDTVESSLREYAGVSSGRLDAR